MSEEEILIEDNEVQQPSLELDLITNATATGSESPSSPCSSKSNESFKIVQNTRGKSSIWQYFGFRDENGEIDKTYAICRKCLASVKYCNNTTNLTLHIKRHHPSVLALNFSPQSSEKKETSQDVAVGMHVGGGDRESPKSFQPTILNVFENNTYLSARSKRAMAITKAITNFIIKDLRPFVVVENEGFKKLIHELEPRYKIPSRTYFSETLIPNLYAKSKGLVADKVKNATHVGLTTDSWTSRSTESYVTITATFITEDWELANYVLQTRKLCESHTGENLAIVLSDAIIEWNISCQPSLVTDNARNMGTMAARGNYKVHIGCFAHTINLAAQKALLVERVSQLLAKIRRIVAYFHRSTTACAVLREKIKMQHLPDHKLIIDVCTRWNSSADMIERFLELQAGVYSALTSKDLRGKEKDLYNLTDIDISLAEDILNCLKPLKTVTTVMCSEKHPTASMILPIYFQLLSLMEYKDDDTECMRQLKTAVTVDLMKRYQNPEVRLFLQKASLLDPRFKAIPFLKDDEKLELYTQVTVEASNNVVVLDDPHIIRSDSSSKELVVVVNDDYTNSPETDTQRSQPKRAKSDSGIQSILGDIYMKTSGSPHADSPVSAIEMVEREMTKYREELGISLTTNPLTWWSAQRKKYPCLAKLAKVYLCVPGTSVPSERVFSTAGDIVSAQRSCLKPGCVDMLIFLKKNVL